MRIRGGYGRMIMAVDGGGWTVMGGNKGDAPEYFWVGEGSL